MIDSNRKTTIRYASKDPYRQIHHIKITRPCEHTIDGAIKVAEYIVEEIKTNTKSKIAESIRYFASTEEYKKRYEEWDMRPMIEKLLFTPEPPNLLKAKVLWTERVFKGREWDHKIHIPKLFKNVAVIRKQYSNIKKRIISYESYYHKYKSHDYFYDVWSNIHYGYVGLSVGFDKKTLLAGASSAQQIDSNGKNKEDPSDDVTAINIGFMLYKKFGKFAHNLTAQDVLDALEAEPDNKFPESRKVHVCLETKE